MKKFAILYSEYLPVIDAIIVQNQNVEFQTLTNFPDKSENFDLIIDVNYKGETQSNVLKCHHSLLPAFPDEEPVKEAFLAGVKVTGITFFYTNPQKILAQYPIFIKNESHFDEIEAELGYLEQVMFPIVVKNIIANKPIDLSMLSAGKCTGGCCGCQH